MEKLKVFFSAEYEEEALKPLYECCDVVKDGWAVGLPKFDEEILAGKVKDADIIITSYDDITRKVIESAPNLRLIACTRATPVNVDMEAAKERNIPVLYTPGRNSDCTAELTIGLMLSVARNIPMAHMALKQGKYTGEDNVQKKTKEGLKADIVWDVGPDSPYTVFKGTQLKGKILGILGYGSIGKKVGRIARAMDMQLLVYDPYQGELEIEEIGIKKAASIDEVMQNADFITSHMKVTEETTGIISKERIAMMKPTAYLINASRGAILDEEALIEALREKRIAGAAFDVYASEPIAKNHPYIQELDNVVITPHIAGAAYDVLANHTKQVVADVKRFLKGEHLLYQYRY